jgi:hypothetical protein
MSNDAPRFRDIPQFSMANYHADVAWDYMFEGWLPDMRETGLDMDPDFQRGHVWTEDKQVAYCEYVLRGGMGAKELFFNHPNWRASYDGEAVLVDGKQRLEAVRRFMFDEIKVFGHFKKEYSDRIDILRGRFSVNINNLQTTAEVYQWYLDLNDGGVVHTKEELDKVRALMANVEKTA